MQAAYALCSEKEEELKLALARKQLSQTVIAETLTYIRALDREQLANRIVAARQSR